MVYLPLASTSLPPLRSEEKKKPTTSQRRVLIVGDNHNIAHSFATLLNLWGHTVQTAPDGLTALGLAHIFQP